MKKFIILIVFGFCLLSFSFFSLGLEDLYCKNLRKVGSYSYVTYLGTSCGNLRVVDCESEYIFAFGEFGVIDADNFDIEKFILENDLILVQKNKIDDLEIYQYVLYKKNLPRYRIVDNKKYNIQLSITKDKIKIGYPSIFDSF